MQRWRNAGYAQHSAQNLDSEESHAPANHVASTIDGGLGSDLVLSINEADMPPSLVQTKGETIIERTIQERLDQEHWDLDDDEEDV